MKEYRNHDFIGDDYMFNNNPLDCALYDELVEPKVNKENVMRLIANGANINATNNSGYESLLMAVLQYMGWHKVNLNTLQFMIELGVDINWQNDEGTNCLYMACLTREVKCVEFLLQAGVNPNVLMDGETILDWADFEAWFSRTDYGDEAGDKMDKIVEMLKQYGAKFKKELN